MEIDFDGYYNFLAECYEAEDEFWKDVYEDMIASSEIDTLKENF